MDKSRMVIIVPDMMIGPLMRSVQNLAGEIVEITTVDPAPVPKARAVKEPRAEPVRETGNGKAKPRDGAGVIATLRDIIRNEPAMAISRDVAMSRLTNEHGYKTLAARGAVAYLLKQKEVRANNHQLEGTISLKGGRA